MRKILMTLLIIIGLISSGFVAVNTNSTIKYKQYVNDRYGFSIEYPNTFAVKVIPDNDDGRIFLSKDKLTELTVSGINNVLDETVNSTYDGLISRSNKPSYVKKKGNWVVASWKEGTKIVYQKTVVGKGSINTFEIKYPSKQKKYYSSIVAHLNTSFETPLINDAH